MGIVLKAEKVKLGNANKTKIRKKIKFTLDCIEISTANDITKRIKFRFNKDESLDMKNFTTLKIFFRNERALFEKPMTVKKM